MYYEDKKDTVHMIVFKQENHPYSQTSTTLDFVFILKLHSLVRACWMEKEQ